MNKAIIVLVYILVSIRLYAGMPLPVPINATEMTQIMNNIELAMVNAAELQQIHAQFQQLSHIVQQGSRLGPHMWGNTMSQLQQLAKIAREGQAMAYSMSQIDSEFRNRFKGYNNYSKINENGHFSQQYQQWSNTVRDSLSGTLKSMNMQYDQFNTEEKTLKQLEQISQSATGRMQAIQAGNQISAQQVRQTQKLRSLMMAQMQAQVSYMAAETDKNDYSQARLRRYYQEPIGSKSTNDKRW